MSKAVIDFCDGLKATLLGIEDRLAKAQESLGAGAAQASGEAKKHVDAASEQLNAFKLRAAMMAQTLRAELPEQSATLREKLNEFSQEAQVAMRHAVVFMAETAAKGAEGAAGALQAGGKQAQKLAENLRHDTAVTVTEPQDDASDDAKPS